MPTKGGISFPMVLVVTIIVVAIIVAFFYIFIFNTKTKLEGVFGDLTKSIGSYGCSALGPFRSFICPGG